MHHLAIAFLLILIGGDARQIDQGYVRYNPIIRCAANEVLYVADMYSLSCGDYTTNPPVQDIDCLGPNFARKIFNCIIRPLDGIVIHVDKWTRIELHNSYLRPDTSSNAECFPRMAFQSGPHMGLTYANKYDEWMWQITFFTGVTSQSCGGKWLWGFDNQPRDDEHGMCNQGSPNSMLGLCGHPLSDEMTPPRIQIDQCVFK